jgi:hypothetical protein
VHYDPTKDIVKEDIFGPLSAGDYIKLPEHVKVEWVGTIEDIEKLDKLHSEPFIGVDSEWRPSMAKFHNTKPALFQIGGLNNIFLVDFFNLGNSEELDKKLTEIFCSKHVTIVGFAF